MITKEQISLLKKQGDGDLESLVANNLDSKSLLFILQNLGYLPKNFDDSWVIPLLSNRSQKIRFWCVKTLGKTKREEYIPILKKVAVKDEATEVRREAVSSIGRLKSPVIISVLFEFLNDDDPKIVLQAIRGLLTFKDDTSVSKQLKSFRNHPNEMIQKVIKKEYFSSVSNTLPKQAHKASYDSLKNVIVLGDVREVLKAVPDESFHLTFTSPPYYNARDYSIYKSYQEYLGLLKEVFELTHQKTKEGRFLIVNTSPIIIPRFSRQHASKRYPIPFDVHNFLVNMGWEFIDDIVWEKPETSVKNRNAGFLQHRKPLAYKPNAVTEYVMVYRKETDRLIDWNIRQYDRETVEESKVEDGYETSNVWEIGPKHDKVHSAVFPVELCRRIVKYYSFKGDLVFDPFAGSGTFGRVAESLNRFYFLTEQEPKYFDYMKINFSEANVFEDTKIAPNFLTLDKFRERKEKMTLTEQVAKNIIRKLLKGEDYRIEIVTLINAGFLQFAIEFFKKVIDAKLVNQTVTVDWYKKAFLRPELPKEEIAINSGLNMKTISNMFNSTRKEVVIDASIDHYDTLYESIKHLVDSEEGLELTLTLKLRNVSVDLNVSETLIVINTLAVKRAALRGGLWSTAGKRVEKPLMQTLCRLYGVPEENYKSELKGAGGQEAFTREIDFYLITDGSNHKCEVKLMGKGNPESADAVFARESKVFVADKLSGTNKRQLDSWGVEWVELRDAHGFERFKTVLENLGIPFTDIDPENLESDVERIFNEIFTAR